jgi:glycine betaine/proline transport system ATP-binding protein
VGSGAGSAIEVRGLTKVFGPRPRSVLPLLADGVPKDEILRRTGHVVGLDDVDLVVREGTIAVVMGLSGSGKSTLVRCLNRLVEPTEGEIRLGGVDVLALSRRDLRELRRRRVAMVFQGFALLPHRSVLDNVALGLQIQGLPRRARRDRAAHWLQTVGLSGYEAARPAELSGGMRQRVGLARALCTDPDVLLMDEPFSALDPLIRREMQEELVRLQGQLGKTIVFITHDLDEALHLGDRVAIMKDGRVVQEGTPVRIVTEPADDYVASFVEGVDRARVLRLEHVMKGATAAADVTAALPATTLLGDALETLASSSRPLAVLDAQERVVGEVRVSDALAALARGRRGPERPARHEGGDDALDGTDTLGGAGTPAPAEGT